MILEEYLNGGTLVKHYSDKGFLLLQNETGAKYADPIDLVPCVYTYTETDEPAEAPEESGEATEGDYISALEELGVNFDEESNVE